MYPHRTRRRQCKALRPFAFACLALGDDDAATNAGQQTDNGQNECKAKVDGFLGANAHDGKQSSEDGRWRGHEIPSGSATL